MRKKISVEQGQDKLFEEYRYCFYITNDRTSRAEQIVFTASVAWTLKAWWGLMLPAGKGRWHERHRQERRDIVKMEFKRFVTHLIRLPCQVIRGGRRLIYRLLNYNPWHSALLRGVAAWRTRTQC